MKTIDADIRSYRVYEAPDGECLSYVGEYDTLAEAIEAAEAGDGGLPKAMWETARAAGHCGGQTAPESLAEGETEDDEPMGWYGDDATYCVVAVRRPKPLANMIRELCRHGEAFTGSDPVGIAQEWLDDGFTARTAAEWLEAGFWEPSVARDLVAAGVDADTATERATALEDACDDPSESYTDGSVIYSVCNRDTDISVLAECVEGDD